ncbi:hypothetical protein WMO13_04760 [Ignatzschineria larvae DSM 13226]|uniref:Uncharacterized protein n=1 Tax=Ignatzschineria larvae DSM 13226 TaxID=1111732 RepID=A0ABZ3C518_9GAMM|nr:hypothetical protein [Ignatzschineria larvae]
MIGLLIALKIKEQQQTDSKLMATIFGVFYFLIAATIDGVLLFLIVTSESLIQNGYLAIAILQVSPLIILPSALISAIIFGYKMLIKS